MQKKFVPIHSAKKATSDFNKKMADFQQLHTSMIQHKMNKDTQKMMPHEPNQFDVHLRSQGIPATHAVKMAIAKKMGMNGYIGGKHQDEELALSHANMSANKAAQEQTSHDRNNQSRELSLKEKDQGQNI